LTVTDVARASVCGGKGTAPRPPFVFIIPLRPVNVNEKGSRSMLKKDFWYPLPKELIAQEPADPRDSARLMVLSRQDDSIRHRIFRDLPEYLEAGDVLVVNNSK